MKQYSTQANEWILNARRQYQCQNKVSKVILNMANHIRLVKTFSDELKRFSDKKSFHLYRYLQVYVKKMSMARSTALPAAIDYLIEISMQFHVLITAIKPARKGSN